MLAAGSIWIKAYRSDATKEERSGGSGFRQPFGSDAKDTAAVNEFKREAIQRSVFNALLAAYGFKVAQATPANAGQAPVVPQGQEVEPAASGQNFRFLRELGLRPEGKKSIFEFVADKAPQSNEDRFAVAVY